MMMKTVSRFIIGLILLPFCYGAGVSFWKALHPITQLQESSAYFVSGIVLYFFFEWIFFRPIRTYVFGHELTHAIATWLSGGKVKEFHVSKNGGHVSVTKTNFVVALAPYVIPLYSVFFLGLYAAINYFYPLGLYWRFFLLFLGMTFGFHMALTIYALQQNQPDLKVAGKFLSGIFIFLGNILCIVGLFHGLFPKSISVTKWGHDTGIYSWRTYQTVGIGIRKGYETLRRN